MKWIAVTIFAAMLATAIIGMLEPYRYDKTDEYTYGSCRTTIDSNFNRKTVCN